MTIIWCMVPEIWSRTDIIFCNSGSFFALLPPYGPRKSNFQKMEKTPEDIIFLQMCTINNSHIIYGSWDMKCNRQNFLSFWTAFCPLLPPNNLKNQNFGKMKKIPRDIITLHMCTIKVNHIMYGSWDMEHNGQNFLSFWTVFCPFTPLTTWKIKILKKWKKSPRDIIILHICTTNDNHMMYVFWDIVRDGQNCLSFGPFFALLPLTTRKIKILQKWK